MKNRKYYLSQIPHSVVMNDPYYDYYETDIIDEGDPTEYNPTFTIRIHKDAVAKLKKNAGRYLFFTTEEPLSDEQLIQRQWNEEDLANQYTSFINQGETTDAMDFFREAMTGRDLSLFLAQIYHDWLYKSIWNSNEEKTDSDPVDDFIRRAPGWECRINKDGSAACEPFRQKLSGIMNFLGITEEDLKKYVETNIGKPQYFSDEYSRES